MKYIYIPNTQKNNEQMFKRLYFIDICSMRCYNYIIKRRLNEKKLSIERGTTWSLY